MKPSPLLFIMIVWAGSLADGHESHQNHLHNIRPESPSFEPYEHSVLPVWHLLINIFNGDRYFDLLNATVQPSAQCTQSLQLIANRIKNYDEITFKNGRFNVAPDRDLLITKSKP